jgi:glycosyltransferase involved in cell wall biosynthesis
MRDPADPLVVAISQGPTPYYTPILNALSALVRLHVIYMSSGAKPASGSASWADFLETWGEPPTFEHSYHRSLPVGISRLDFHARFSIGISGKLRRLNPDVVLVHSWGPLMIEPLVWSHLAHRRTVMWTESSAATGLLRDPITGFARRRLVALSDAFVSTGTPATKFIENLGADPQRVVRSCLPSALAEAIMATPRQPVRRRDSVGTEFLFVGRLVERKRPVELARAFMRASPFMDGARLTFIGSGPLLAGLAEIAGSADGRIRLLERAEGQALIARYIEADVLVLPSVREVWGLVVNEALAAGLYVVATDQVASAVDLLNDRSGLVVPVDDPDRLEDALIAADKADKSDLGRDARKAQTRGCTRWSFAADMHRAIGLALSG